MQIPTPASQELAVQVPSPTCGRGVHESPLPPVGEGQGEGVSIPSPAVRETVIPIGA